MLSSTLLSVGAAAVAAFVLGFVWYMALGARLVKLSPAYAAEQKPAASAAAMEFARCLIIAAVLAVLAARSGAQTLASGMVLGLLAWVGFPLTLFAGSVLHEQYPWRLAAIHLGDWLLKLMLVGGIVAAWH
jgi:Protein of unknown function (DUF1761)